MTARLLEERPRHRAAVVRKAVIYTPPAVIAVVLTGVALDSIVRGDTTLPVGLIIFGLFALSFSYQSIAALRDLRAAPVTTRGPVRRVWTRSRLLFIGRIRYLLVANRVFEIGPVAHVELQGGETVEIVHWPHTNAIVTLHLHDPEPEQEPGQRHPRGSQRPTP